MDAAIHWTIKGERIGDRARPLAAKTMARIEDGLERKGAEPFLHIQRGEFRNRSVSDPGPTISRGSHCAP